MLREYEGWKVNLEDRSVLPGDVVCIEKNVRPRAAEERIDRAAHGAEINVRGQGIGHVGAGEAAGVDMDDVRLGYLAGR